MVAFLYLLITHFYKMILSQIVTSSYSSSPDVFLCFVSNGYSEIVVTIDLFLLIFRRSSIKKKKKV